MKTFMCISVRVFPVKIKDERTGLEMEDSIVLEKPKLQAAQLVGLDSTELIRRIFNRRGYKVIAVGSPIKKEITLDLKRLYAQSIEATEKGFDC